MFFQISFIAGSILELIAILCSIAVCFMNGGHTEAHFTTISSQCRMAGAVYLVLSWFLGDSHTGIFGRDTYAAVSWILLILAVGWFLVFFLSVLSNLWSTGEKKWRSALAWSIVCFLLGYLLH